MSNKYIEQLVKMAEEKKSGGLGTAAALTGAAAIGAIGMRKYMKSPKAQKFVADATRKAEEKVGVAPKQGTLF